MNQIETINRGSKLTVYKSADIRRRILEMPNVMDCLTKTERMMLEVSVQTSISDFKEEELFMKAAVAAKYITRDVGIKNIEDYDIKRFVDILRTYYHLLSLREVMIAFEFAEAGKLDDYLPRDKDGNPDKNHYQAFNVGYITKILNAYNKLKKETEHKAYTALPKPKSQITPETKAYYIREMKRAVIVSFLAYKYRGKLPDNVNSFLIYAEIERLGLAEPIQVTEADKKEAVAKLLMKAQTGIIKEFIAECIRHLQTKHSDVIAEAGLIAKEKALIKSFEVMAKEEIQITDYITLN